MRFSTALRWVLRAVTAASLMLGLSGHYRSTPAVISSPFWRGFFLVFGIVLLLVDWMLPQAEVPELRLPFGRKADDDAPTRLDL
jgi:hypothetical protein